MYDEITFDCGCEMFRQCYACRAEDARIEEARRERELVAAEIAERRAAGLPTGNRVKPVDYRERYSRPISLAS